MSVTINGSVIRSNEAGEEPPDQPRVLRTRTFDDVAANLGSALASFAAVWLVFDQLVGLEGVLDFVVCWFVAYLAFYVVVSLRTLPGVAVVDRVMSAVLHLGALVACLALGSAIVFVFVKGWPALHHLNFFT